MNPIVMTRTSLNFTCCLALAAAVAIPAMVRAQSTSGAPAQLSLTEALTLAEQRSQTLKIAEAALERAQGQRYQSRSQLMPQINGSAGYQRTIESQFQAISKSSGRVPHPVSSLATWLDI